MEKYLLQYNSHLGTEIVKKFACDNDSAAVAFAKRYMSTVVYKEYILQGINPRKEWYKVFTVARIDPPRQIFPTVKSKPKN